MRTKNHWICQMVSRWLLGSTTINSSSNLRQLQRAEDIQHLKLYWMSCWVGRPRLQYLNHLREARHLWQFVDRHTVSEMASLVAIHVNGIWKVPRNRRPWENKVMEGYKLRMVDTSFRQHPNEKTELFSSRGLNLFAPRRCFGLLMGPNCQPKLARYPWQCLSPSIESRAMSQSFRMHTAAAEYTVRITPLWYMLCGHVFLALLSYSFIFNIQNGWTLLPCWLSIQGTCKEACLPNPSWVLDVLLRDAACR